MVPAHGVGTRSDLPVPLGPAAAAASVTLIISFVVLAFLWRSPRSPGGGRPLPRVVTDVVDHPATRTTVRAVALAVLIAVINIGFVGPDDPSDNVAPWAFYVTFWAGLVPLSLLLGPVVRYANPLRLLHRIVTGALRIDPDGLRTPPASVGYWPAAASLTAFAWLELVAPGRAEPATVAGFLAGYAVVQVAAATVFGARWFDRGDGFEVYSSLIGGLSPVGRLDDGRFGLRNPLDGLERLAPGPGLVGVVVALVGTTGYDGISRTTWWTSTVTEGVLGGTLGLAATTLAVGVIYLLGCAALTPHGAHEGQRPGPATFATTLAPIAAGYAIAHYFSLLVFDGQQTFILAGDPLGTGADLLGLAGTRIDYTLLGPIAIMAVQLLAIVTGHLVASVAAHDRAVRLYRSEDAVRTQYPMLAAMVALTIGAVGLLFAG
ncbi:hypothetical protein EV378_2662 [Pseudonocardia endophytica]|uniref:Fenitrothion hydrolase n=2 Tax=Pseudonocardia endophytica TaxID=401976 RepID=A0A4R1HVQ5_PSEEN|nr:hypothetical protein EV378_2662 [Pseudonocardia endophytica]